MAAKAAAGGSPQGPQVLTWLACIALAGGLLYVARAVLVPVALAVLLTFLLAPPVIRLQRLGLPKVVAVLAVVTLAFALLGGVGWLVTRQILTLAGELPQHRPRVEAKIENLKRAFGSGGGVVEDVSGFVEDVQTKLEDEVPAEGGSAEREAAALPPADPTRDAGRAKRPEPLLVRIEPEESGFAAALSAVAAPLVGPLATAGLVVVLVLFILLTREDLRNRIVSLSGQTNLAVTTKAIDEAGRRIARFLLMQAAINAVYGLAVTVGLLVLRVPYAPLWGVAAAVLRYVPYVGPWVAAALPLGYSVLTSSGWWQPLAVLALIVVLELVSNNIVEPLLYGRGIGVSAVGVILAAVFWGWIWGPVGLVLATPLTVCLVVAGRHVPELGFFNRLLGDVPEIEPHFVYYQRLLAKDDDEAEELLADHSQQVGLAAASETVLVPALELAKRDRMRGLIESEQFAFVVESAVEHVEDVPDVADSSAEPAGDANTDAGGAADRDELPLVFGYGLREPADAAMLALMERLLAGAPCRFMALSSSTLVSELIERIRTEGPYGLCLLGLPPGGLTYARRLVKRLRAIDPELKIAIGRWGAALSDRHRDALLNAGASYVGSTPAETRDHALSISRLQPAGSATASTRSAACGIDQ
jgi:predicted PurR-regulated permease PerM